MKGRENLEDIQQFLDAVIIGSFTFKYALLPKRREAVSPNELHLWNLYKSQEEYFRGMRRSMSAFYVYLLCFWRPFNNNILLIIIYHRLQVYNTR